MRVRNHNLEILNKEKDIEHSIPLSHLSGVILHKGISLSSDSLFELCKVNIPVTIKSQTQVNSIASLSSSKMLFLPSDRVRFELAKSLLLNSLNQRNSISFIHGPPPSSPVWDVNCDWREKLRAWEGAWTKKYWESFKHYLKLPKEWNRRTSHPISSALDYLGVVLVNRLIGVLAGIGIDPWSEAFHVSGRGRPALACDIAEELRWPLIEKVIIDCWTEERWGLDEKGMLDKNVRARLIKGTETEWKKCLGNINKIKNGILHYSKHSKTRKWKKEWTMRGE